MKSARLAALCVALAFLWGSGLAQEVSNTTNQTLTNNSPLSGRWIRENGNFTNAADTLDAIRLSLAGALQANLYQGGVIVSATNGVYVQPGTSAVFAINGGAGQTSDLKITLDSEIVTAKTDQTTHGTTDKVAADLYQGGAVVGAANPVQVSIANTAANATAVKVTGTGGTFPVTGTFWQAIQTVKSDQTTHGTTDKVAADLYQGGAVVGSANPVLVSLANNAANATAVKVDGTGGTFPVTNAAMTSIDGKIATPVAATDKWQYSGELTDTTITAVKAGAPTYYYCVTSLSAINGDAAVNTDVFFYDDDGVAGGEVIRYGGHAASGGMGFAAASSDCLFCTETAGNGIYVQAETTSAEVHVNVKGFRTTTKPVM